MALGALALAPSFAFGTNKRKVGLQLYSLREEFPKNVKGLLEQIGKIGYKEVETYGYSVKDGFFGTSVADFKKILTDNGLTAASNHFDFNGYFGEGKTDILKNYIETANVLGSEYVTIPWLLPNLRGKNTDDFKKMADKINQAAGVCKASGLKLAYHNHDFEFEKFENTTGYEVLLNNTDKNLVDFEMDLYWVVRSGNDPLKLFKEHPGRFKMWHVKDMDKAKPEWNTEIGNGAIDFKAIFAQANLSGMKHFFVEHETNYVPNPLESVRTSFNYVEKQLA